MWSFYLLGQDNLVYSKMGILLPILYLFPLALAKLAGQFGYSVIRFFHLFASLVNPFITALMGTIFFQIFRKTRSVSFSVLMATLVLSSSLLLPYSKTCHREPVQALLLLLAFFFLEQETSRYRFLWAATAIGLGFLTKVAFIVPAIPMMVLGSIRAYRSNKLISFFVPLLAFVLLYLIHSFSISGAPFSGYGPKVVSVGGGAWKTEFSVGFWSQWIWSYRGLLFYSPVLLGLILIPRTSWKVSSLFAIFFSVILQTILYSKWTNPWGGESLGPRYLVVILPLLLILFRDTELKSRTQFITLGLLAIISIGIQVPLTAVKIQQYYTMESRSPKSFKAPAWQVTPRVFLSKLSGKDEIYPLSLFNIRIPGSVDVRDVESLQGLNFWWYHLWRNGIPS